MTTRSSRHLVCCFTLPASLRPADIADWVVDMVMMHSGIRVAIVPESDDVLQIFANSEKDRGTVRTVIETNRADWRGAGVTDIRSAV